MIDEELEADVDMAWRYDMELCLARAPPQVCVPPGTITHFSHLRVISEFWQSSFKTPFVPDGCIYRSDVFVREDPISNVSFDIILGRKHFSKILPLNPKGKVALGSF